MFLTVIDSFKGEDMETMELMNSIKIYCKYIIAFILYIGLLLIGAIGGGTRPGKDIWDDLVRWVKQTQGRPYRPKPPRGSK